MSYPSRSPPNRAYSPSGPVHRSRSRSHSPRRYDDRRPPRREYDRDREFDDRVPPPRDRDRDERVPPPRHRDRDYYDDRPRRDHDSRERDYGAPRRDDRDRRDYDRAPRGRFDDSRAKSDPSRDVIFLGLDPELTEKELEGYLRVEHGYDVESSKIVRERATGQSKGFGFAQFSTLEQSTRFMKDNFPHVTMPALFAHSEPRRVKIDFAGSRLDDAPTPVPQLGARHDGTRDIGQPGGGSRVLLLRGLDPGTYAGEVVRRLAEEITRMLGKGTQRDAEACISRVVMIVDRASAISWGFAFVELVTPELASALMPFLFLPQHQPTGFLISGVPIAASFANVNAFIPTPCGPMGGQFLLRAAADGGIGATTITSPDGEYCTYWHQQAGAVETLPRGAPPVPARGASIELSDETRRFLGNLGGKWKPPKAAASASGVVNSPTESSTSAQAAETPTGPLVGGMQPIKIGFGNAIKKKPKEEPVMVEIMSKALVDDNDEVDLVGKDSTLPSRTKGAHIVPPTSTSRKVAGFINKWNTKQTELSKPRQPKAPGAPPAGVSAANAAPLAQVPVPAPHQAQPQPSSNSDFDYGDTYNFAATGKVACLLCQRQFKSEEMLRKHNAQSELHKARTSIPEPQAGKRRKNNAVAAQTGSNLQFRDRAAERREVHQQPDRPALPPDARLAAGSREAAPAPALKPIAPAENVGNKLLAKMGWTGGTGLGVNEDGRAEPVRVQQFEQRAGLGAAAGRDPGRWSGPGGWQRRAQDMTQERFQAADRQNQSQNQVHNQNQS
ncbi:hypothetical protein CC85DRAFT_329392 [Cutaneotrichosporon oleaginosum]|uniref:G-patch domain-containing protein n=1 Tax=Cutaneotrichosporon oleaginosum TaxID=879819 RepID=A0A0J0XIW7_9TREE|nr:uncharacterized protein CC85DRAFT_329392 [Cutaneotrichosporon oleaginosum]KLT41040.1 hypothetical protein CC85DRAFT_329392 [Cutaneotrichosporon oleaginosum]TXT12132.1 hypothetical protein COLE_02542 [Cutaneotrichosporon oleaginosum]